MPITSVGIICEYNPHHRGHAYQIAEIRRRYPEAAVIAVMSGAFVQRGEPAIAPAVIRAEQAVLSGADLVIELPYPWSCAPAELFARGGIALLAALHADAVCFGTEGDCLSDLIKAAEHLDDPKTEDALRAAREDPSAVSLGYPILRERVISALWGDEEAALLRTPNNALAAEYLRAAKALHADLTPIAVPRKGDAHDTVPEMLSAGTIASATAIRALLKDGKTEAAFSLLPESAVSPLRRTWDEGHFVIKSPDDLLLWHYRTTPPDVLARYAGLSGGVAERLCTAAAEAVTADDLLSRAATKKYTDAYLRRALWHGFFETTLADMKALPPYIKLLAADRRGTAHLAALRKKDDSLPILSTPADSKFLPEAARAAFERSRRAEIIQAMLFRNPVSAANLLRIKPFILPR